VKKTKPKPKQLEFKRRLGIDVLTAARERISWTFDSFPRIYLSGPSGKDSGAMMHLVCQEARRRGRKVGILYVDLEAQYALTIAHVREMFALYADVIDPHWVALPLRLRNAVSMEQPYWVCWDPECPESWVRQPPPEACTDASRYPFHERPRRSVPGEAREAMEFEEFVERFGHWYANGEACACFVGIRSDESLNRWRAVTRKRKSRLEGKPWTSWKGGDLVNVYPIFDWRTEDVWTYYGKEGLPYNRLYDLMWKAGLSIHQQRICQPYGDDQRRGLAMYHVVEPETWTRVVARVAGANSGALYAGKRGNILGNGKVTLPPNHTWQSFARFLLGSLPNGEREHYENKIAVFLRWYEVRGVAVIPDDTDPELAKRFPNNKGPSWMRICKCILKNDRMCRSLSFSQHVSGSYERYHKIMKKRRESWGY
jgi:predicted phosphoadenosine phosphosulfate sulfurtransferase